MNGCASSCVANCAGGVAVGIDGTVYGGTEDVNGVGVDVDIDADADVVGCNNRSCSI